MLIICSFLIIGKIEMRLKIGQAIYKDAKIIFPYCRSITGTDTYKTLVFLSRGLKNFKYNLMNEF